LRKFAFDKTVELGVPESIADFMQGRTPKTIGAKHYLILLRQAQAVLQQIYEGDRERQRQEGEA